MRASRTPRRWLAIFVLGALAAAAAMTAAVWLFVDDQSLMTYKRQMVDYKLTRLDAVPRDAGGAVVFVSGSNALYSLDSAVIEDRLHRPVVNAAVHWGLALYMAERVATRLQPGDILVLPMEYDLYVGDPVSETEACYRLAQARDRLAGAPDRIVAAFTSCPPRLLAYGLVMRARAALLGPAGWSAVDDMNRYGDLVTNSAPASRPPGTLDRFAAASLPAPPDDASGAAFERLGAAVAKAQARGARVFVSFPATPPLLGESLGRAERWRTLLQGWVQALGVELLSSPSAHSFPSDCVFDMQYHLHRGCAPRNAAVYAEALASRLDETLTPSSGSQPHSR